MTFDEFKRQLGKYLEDDSSSQCVAKSHDAEVLTAPFEDFFGEPLFLLLYHCDQALSVELDSIRYMVRGLADISNSERDRALLALGLAKIAREQNSADVSCNRAEIEFLNFAMKLGSVQAHIELAVTKLRDAKLSLADTMDGHPLPCIKVDDDSRKPRLFLTQLGVTAIWRAGADLALAASEENFPSWTLEELSAAFACVVHLSAIPESLIKPRELDSNEARKLRLWTVPLLKLLYERISEIANDDKLLLKNLRRQIYALQAFLAAAMRSDHESVIDDGETESNADTTTVVIIKGVIPKASDRSDNEILTQYEALRKPLALAQMPTRERLVEIQSILQSEFPWATAAIDAILSEVLARKRFGARILGMQPVLLCGPPGTGKTRLSQRFGDLLQIPNTVINLAGMTDTKTLKGVTRGWASNRPSRIIECILHNGPTHLFLLDEVDKAHGYYGGNGGDPQEALLDLLEPLNSRRYGDVFLQTECDVSHCLYIATANSLGRISQPLLSRLTLAYVPAPGPEHSTIIAEGVLRDVEKSWRIPSGALEISQVEMNQLIGLSPREMRRAVMRILGEQRADPRYTLR